MNRALWLSLAPLALLLTGCPPAVDTGPDGGATGPFTVGPEGGKFVRDGVYFDIPADAVGSETTITVSVLDTGIPEVPNRRRVSYGYRITPSSLQFQKPIIVAFTWIDNRVPQGVQPITFDMRRSSGTDAYLELPGPSVVDNELLQLKALTARTDRLGLFWITSPSQPAVSEIVLTPEDAFLQVGGEQKFTAEIRDPGGNVISDVPLSWTIVAPRVASVDTDGLVKALGPGIATLTVTGANVSAKATVRVQGTTKGPTTFVHENPFPTGNDLWGGALGNGHAYFVGGNGTVLSRSPTDVWTRLFSTPGVTFKAVAGNFPTSAVAVGTSVNTGVLVEVNAGSTTPVIKTFTSSQPRAVWFNGTYGMAVGDGNDVLIRRNGAWVTEYSPSFESLMSVVGDGAGGFVTVGNNGSLYKYDPAIKVWNSLFQTNLSVQLTAGAIVDAAGNEAWAVGGNKLWHFVTNGWTALNLPASPVLTNLQAIGVLDSRIIVAGSTSAGAGHLLVYEPTGATWTSQTVKLPQIIRGIFGSGTTGYAVGDYGAVWEYQTATHDFIERSRGFIGHVADLASDGTNTVAAMNICSNAACTSIQPSVLTRSTSGDWVKLGTTSPFGAAMTAITMRNGDEVYAATANKIYVYDGSTWSALTGSAASASFTDLALCGTSLFAVGGSGSSYKGTSATEIRSVALNPLGSNAACSTNAPCAAPTETCSGASNGKCLFSADIYGTFCPTPTETWSTGFTQDGVGFLLQGKTARNTQGVNQAPYLNVWSPGPGEAFAFGDARFGGYWDTANINTVDQLGGIAADVVTSQWGSTADNHYLVGYSSIPVRFSFALRSDGAQWQIVDPGSEKIPTVVTGSSNTDVWVGTQFGGILRGVNPP